MLRDAGVPHEEKELDDRAQQDRLVQKHKALSFPIVLAGGKYVGGFTHILLLHASHRLPELAADEVEVTDRVERTTRAPPAPAPTRTPTTPPPAEGGLAGLAAWGEHLRQQKR